MAGAENFTSGDGGGVGPANAGGNRAHDGAHVSFIFRSPTLNFSGAGATGDLGGGNVLSWGTSGGAGDQNNHGAGFYANPAAVIADNSGNSHSAGQKGLAFLNLGTGNYDAVLFNNGNGGTDTRNFSAADLTLAGVDLTENYQLDFFETDQGGWGWGQMNFVNIASGAPVVAPVPEPASIAIWSLLGLCLAGYGYRRHRRNS